MVTQLQLSGSPDAIGYAHGTGGKQQIHQSLTTYERLFHEYSGVTWQEACEIAKVHLPAIERADHQLVEEMQGIARGAGVEFADILALNARSEIALAGGKAFSDGCTAIAITPPLAEDTIIGQNWDWKADQRNSLLHLTIKQKGKPTITMMTEGGIIGKIGMNSAGIGVCLNALITDKKSAALPLHLGLRRVLDSSSLHEAIGKIDKGQIAASANFLIGYADQDGNGLAMNTEVSPYGIEMEASTEGKLVHTNHICSNLLRRHVKDLNEFIFTDSMIRKARAEQLINLSTRNQSISEMDFKRWFSDTYNYPNSINHADNENTPDHRRMETVFSIIMNLSKREMHLCIGKPAEGNYKKLEAGV